MMLAASELDGKQKAFHRLGERLFVCREELSIVPAYKSCSVGVFIDGQYYAG